MLAFATVGSTRFDSLVQSVFSEPVLLGLRYRGYTNLVVQCGNSQFDLAQCIEAGNTERVKKNEVDIEFWKFKPSLQEEFEKADLIISHAGSGTVLDVLRLGKTVIVVPNPTLLDHHQDELAKALSDLGYLKTATISDLPQAIAEIERSSLQPFPPQDKSRSTGQGDLWASMGPRTLETATIEGDVGIYEDKTVHAVYDAIASHFSSTRYKPWPVIAAFLSGLPTGWIGLDSGTGNGKYLPLPLNRPGDIWTIGLDRSLNLLAIARTAGGGESIREVVRGNVLDNGWRPGVFDYAISVATIHHLATEHRRMIAVQRLIQAVSPDHGRILIYVWAIEQDQLSKRKVLDEQGALATTGKDVIVPWVLTVPTTPGTGSTPEESKKRPVYNRYYHMFAKGELAGLVTDAAMGLGLRVSVKPDRTERPLRGVEILQDGWERSNYYVELRCWTAL